MPWVHCCEVPPLHLSYPYPQPRLCPPLSCSTRISQSPILLDHLLPRWLLSGNPLRLPHSKLSISILTPPLSASPPVSKKKKKKKKHCYITSTTLLAWYPQHPYPFLLNITHCWQLKALCPSRRLASPTSTFRLLPSAGEKPHNYGGCI